ncbi:probable methyltransferase-like protein 25 [Dreissena polymorpha]|uniref:Methyltransferase domain-containing protein n=1 Tax=Dreissena polymorpha TaxID=45954 RepID=A0A9D4D165_DREPO|nr:probable methyltransferase-like protein 25 [Dreissena polymorpha]KAH3735981.1 hypothetical protein DPMN_042542 [Dreissena polymorpha]
MKLERSSVENSLQKILTFLLPNLPVANAHASEFITTDQWQMLSPGIQHELLRMTDEQLRRLPLDAHTAYYCCGGIDNKAGDDDDNDHVRSSSSDCYGARTDDGGHDVNDGGDGGTGELNIANIAHHMEELRLDVGNGGTDNISNLDTVKTHSNKEDPNIEETTAETKYSISELSFLSDLFSCVQGCSIEGSGLCVTVQEFIQGIGHSDHSQFIGAFMNSKKSHEVEVMCSICAALHEHTGCDLVLDFGSGKGYLGNQLVLQHSIPVIGVDARSVNTTGAERRKLILSKQWEGLERNFKIAASGRPKLTNKEKKKLKASITDKACTNNGNATLNESKEARFVPCTKFIDKNTDFMEIVNECFLEIVDNKLLYVTESSGPMNNGRQQPPESDGAPNICNNLSHENCVNHLENGKLTTENSHVKILLTGLHTCGNLASASLELFVHSPVFTSLCNVGCCYHKLQEQFRTRKVVDNEHENIKAPPVDPGFPMSQFLKQRGISLGNTALNLAAQSVHRVAESSEPMQGSKFYPRALLEVLVSDLCPGFDLSRSSHRKRLQKAKSDYDYVRAACNELGLSDMISDDHIHMYLKKYSDARHKMAAFVQLKTTLAPCIEAVVILDRVCYLLEQEAIREVHIVKMFDPLISPRCYGIIAMK